jgi:phosphatidate cytidylyltransferase
MKRVLTAVVLIPLVLLVVFKAPLWLFAVVVAGIVVLALHEYLGIAEAAGLKPFHWPAYIMALLPFLMTWGNVSVKRNQIFAPSFFLLPSWVFVIVGGAMLLGVLLVFRTDLKMGMASVAAPVFGVVYTGVTLSLLVVLREDHDINLVAFLLFSVWAGDIAAYYVGRNFGRHKLAPIVSPNKSWEGAVASVIASVVVGFLILYFRPFDRLFLDPRLRPAWQPFAAVPSTLHIICLGIVTNIAAQFGDLFESALKRAAGVKDSGTLLPGHGGILDRIDALLFAIPAVWYYASQAGLLLQLKD